MSQQQNILKRSHKADFTAVNRERSFVKTGKEKRRSQTFVKPAIELYRPPNVRSDISPSSGKLNVHAKEFTMTPEQQRRGDDQNLQSSKSSGSVNNITQQQHYHHHYQQQQQHQQNALQHSKSSGSILKSPPGAWQFIPVPAGLHMATHAGLLHSNSTSTLLQHLHHHNQQQQIAAAAAVAAQHRVTFHQQQQQMYGQQPFSCIYPTTSDQVSVATPTNVPAVFRNQPPGAGSIPYHVNGTQHTNLLLKRSKSFTTGAPEHQATILPTTRLVKNLSNISEDIPAQYISPNPLAFSPPLLTKHSITTTTPIPHQIAAQLEDLTLTYATDEERQSLRVAIDDPQQLPSRTLMDLVRVIMERLVVEGMTYAECAAKLCAAIAARERESGRETTFVESLVNTCQQWYRERDKILRSIKSGDGTRFTAFMWFITELVTRLKRHQRTNGDDPCQQPIDLILLSILAKCCQACVRHPIRCLAETECLFFVLTSIGRELELELPQQLDQLMASVRDGFLDSSGSSAVRKTLLQLIELHASNWQLTGSSVLYYYPRIK